MFCYIYGLFSVIVTYYNILFLFFFVSIPLLKRPYYSSMDHEDHRSQRKKVSSIVIECVCVCVCVCMHLAWQKCRNVTITKLLDMEKDEIVTPCWFACLIHCVGLGVSASITTMRLMLLSALMERK